MNNLQVPTSTRELLSALADDELRGAPLVAAVRGCDQADDLAIWGTYHLIGETLRQPSLAVMCSDADFLARLNKRFELEHVVISVPTPAVQGTTARAGPVALTEVSRRTGPAANDGNIRWKLLSGFASLAAVSAIGWSAVGGSGLSVTPQLAQSSQPVLVASPLGPMVRDARFEELLLAHRQMGGGLALQAPSGFLRNAAFEAPQGSSR